MSFAKDAKPPVQLDVTTLAIAAGESTHSYQTLSIQLTQPQTLIHPGILTSLTLPFDLDCSREVILFGQAPNWLYNALIHQCHDAPWIGCFDARTQSVVVIHSRVAHPEVGDVLFPLQNRQPCPAILIGGPPNSGKSVFASALRRCLVQRLPERRLFLHRASWDGEGNWAYESPNLALVDQLVQMNEYRIHEDPETAKLIPDYFRYHARAVANLRRLVDILLVDVGGMPQPEKKPLVEQCTHYVVISRIPDAISAWHQLCQPLTPVAVIHSVLEESAAVLKTKPLFEITAGPWTEEQLAQVPQVLANAVIEHL